MMHFQKSLRCEGGLGRGVEEGARFIDCMYLYNIDKVYHP